MNSTIRRVAIIDGMRTPFVRSFTSFANYSCSELMVYALKALVEKKSLQGVDLGEVALGCVMKPTSDWNLAREAVMKSGLGKKTPGLDLIRACATGLEASIAIANKIALGQIDVGISGGVDSNSDIPLVFSKSFSTKLFELKKAKTTLDKIKILSSFKIDDLKPQLPMVVEPQTQLSMGQHCGLMAKEWKISREEQDQLAFESHQKAAKAWESGFFKEFVAPVGKILQDNNVRKDTSLEKLSKLKCAFDGDLTAGNSTPLTDGASCALLASEEYAKSKNWKILGYLEDVQVAAVDYTKGAGLLMAPVDAIDQLLSRNKLSYADFDFFEIHEAFAAQVLCTLKALEPKYGKMDRSKMNILGGSVALGHPFAATGARILVQAAKILDLNQKNKCMISICTGGGMGVVAIVSRI